MALRSNPSTKKLVTRSLWAIKLKKITDTKRWNSWERPDYKHCTYTLSHCTFTDDSKPRDIRKMTHGGSNRNQWP
jgi:hypothetical protein